jgi:hypothetical protein
VPKINGPEVSKGFYLTLGVLAALLVMSVITMALQSVRKSKG